MSTYYSSAIYSGNAIQPIAEVGGVFTSKVERSTYKVAAINGSHITCTPSTGTSGISYTCDALTWFSNCTYTPPLAGSKQVGPSRSVPVEVELRVRQCTCPLAGPEGVLAKGCRFVRAADGDGYIHG